MGGGGLLSNGRTPRCESRAEAVHRGRRGRPRLLAGGQWRKGGKGESPRSGTSRPRVGRRRRRDAGGGRVVTTAHIKDAPAARFAYAAVAATSFFPAPVASLVYAPAASVANAPAVCILDVGAHLLEVAADFTDMVADFLDTAAGLFDAAAGLLVAPTSSLIRAAATTATVPDLFGRSPVTHSQRRHGRDVGVEQQAVIPRAVVRGQSRGAAASHGRRGRGEAACSSGNKGGEGRLNPVEEIGAR